MLVQQEKIHFLGIGGIGMSALALYYHQHGLWVSGYDKTPSLITEKLESAGIKVFFDQNPGQLDNITSVIYTPALAEQDPLLAMARQRGLRVQKRSQALGEICKNKQVIAVAGTHGKTTTASMIAFLLRAVGIDVTAFIGGIANNFEGNFVLGNSNIVVVEADEFDKSFLCLSPDLAIITALDPDHLDVYGTYDAMLEAYLTFAQQVKDVLIVHQSLLPLFNHTQTIKAKIFSYGNTQNTDFQYAISEWDNETLNQKFFITYQEKVHKASLPMPGNHNVANVCAAITGAYHFNSDLETLLKQLRFYRGVWRRFEYQIITPYLVYIDDYAHHPAEIEALITSVRALYPGWYISVIFQPHLYTRTRDFATGFAKALDLADACYLAPIYPARELSITGVTSDLIFQQMSIKSRKHITLSEFDARSCLVHNAHNVVLTIGAGDIDRIVQTIKHQLSLAHLT